MGHVHLFTLSFTDASDERHHLAFSENDQISECLPPLTLVRLDGLRLERQSLSAAPTATAPPGVLTDQTRMDISPETEQGRLIYLLLGEYGMGEVRQTTMEGQTILFRSLHYDGRELFHIESVPSVWGGSRYELGFASDIARELYGESRVVWQPSLHRGYFGTEKGDAVFVYAPDFDYSWFLMDIGPVPWGDDIEIRSYVTLR
jgi:hypothetical protein